MTPPLTPGEKIRIARESLSPKMTQSQLADAINIKRSRLAQYEAGRTSPPAKILSQIAEVTGRDLAWFLEGADENSHRLRWDAISLIRPATPFVRMRSWPAVPFEGEIPSDRSIDSVQVPSFLSGMNRIAVPVRDDRWAPMLNAGDVLIVTRERTPRVGRLVIASNDHLVTALCASRSQFGVEYRDLTPERAPVSGSWTSLGYVIAIARGCSASHGSIEWDEGGIGF